MFAVSLAGSLFFSISPTAAKDKVLLYLLLTMGPFAVVAPALGSGHRPQPRGPPGHGGGVGPGPGGAVPVPGPRHPLAAPVPRGLRHAGAVQGLPGHQRCAGPGDGRPRACSTRPGSATAGGVGPTADRTEAGEPPTRLRTVRAEPAAAGPTPRLPTGTPVVRVDDPATGTAKVEPDLATLNARLGSAGLAVRLRLRPARRGHPQAGGRGASSVLWVSMAVFAAAAAAGARLPVPVPARPGPQAPAVRRRRAGRRRGARLPAPPVQLAPGRRPEWAEDEEDLAAFRPIADTEVTLALMPMSVLKALVGFTTFLFAFGLRRDGRGHLVVRARPRGPSPPAP